MSVKGAPRQHDFPGDKAGQAKPDSASGATPCKDKGEVVTFIGK